MVAILHNKLLLLYYIINYKTYLYVIQLDYIATVTVTQYDNDTSNDNGHAGYNTRTKIMIIMIMGVFARRSLLFYYCD